MKKVSLFILGAICSLQLVAQEFDSAIEYNDYIIAQQNRGMVNKSMPGIRIDQIVTMKFTAAKIDEVPTNKILRIQIA